MLIHNIFTHFFLLLGFNSSQQHSPIYYSEDHVLNRIKYSEQGLHTNDQHFRCEFNLPKINIDNVDTRNIGFCCIEYNV